MLLPWNAVSGLSGCGSGCDCGPCSQPLRGLGTTVPPVQVKRYAGQNVGESTDAFFARMRASQKAAGHRTTPPPTPSSSASASRNLQTTLQNRQRQQAPQQPSPDVQEQIAERQKARGIDLEQAASMAQVAGSIAPAGGEGSFLTSAGFLLPVAVGGAGAAAGSLLYHAPSSLDRERSSKTIKRKELQSTATAAVGGAASGAAIGTLIFPGIGTAIGAVVGGGAGAVAGLLNGKKLKKKNKKLAQQAAFAAAAEQQALDEAQEAALEAQREYQAEVTNLRLDMEAKVREGNRWAIAIRQLRGDEASATLLLNELGALRAALLQEQDLDTMNLLVDQAEESVEDMRSIAEAAEDVARVQGRANRGLSGLGGVDDYVLEARRRNRAALGLPPQEDMGSSMSTGAKVALGVGVLGLAQWLYWRSRGRR